MTEFMTEFNNYYPNIKFAYKLNKESIRFLDLNVSLSGSKLTTALNTKSTDKHQYFIIHLHTQPTLNVPLLTRRH